MGGDDNSQVDDFLSDLRAIDLAELNSTSALQTRIDRKYLCSHIQAIEVLEAAARSWFVLDIDGRRTFEYRSLYFDTPKHDSFHGSARQRRRRFKVRRRAYDGVSPSVLEVKTRGMRGQTVKSRIDISPPNSFELGSEEMIFIDATTRIADLGRSLRPSIWTSYRRATLADPQSRARVSIDRNVSYAVPDGDFAPLTASVVLETKTLGGLTSVDRALWALKIRPVAFSKFAVSCAMSNRTLPSNRWHRVIDRHDIGM